MSFKRSDLAALGIEPEKIQTLIDWHTETVKALQAKIAENEDNGDKHEWYLDAYKKFENVVVPESVVK